MRKRNASGAAPGIKQCWGFELVTHKASRIEFEMAKENLHR
jgi:hypothetical protein